MSLIQKLTHRIEVWTSILLSLAGRVQLVKSVLFAMQAFWSNHFILPIAIHETIQSMLTRFIWRGNIVDKGGAKVSWQTICLPREEGGLGIKDPSEWNKSQIICHLLKVINHAPTLWASWVNKTILKRKHFWIIPIPTDCSWIWKKLLRLRDLALHFISYSIGDGNTISLWFEPWCNSKCLAKSTTAPIISQCTMNKNARVHDIINTGSWRLPTPNHRHHHFDPTLSHWLLTFNYPNFNLNVRDVILWDGLDLCKVKTRHVWESLRHRTLQVQWYHAVWHQLKVERYAHHQWLLSHGRLNTLARLARFGIDLDQQCFLCVGGRETDTHLYLFCPYSRYVLTSILMRFNLGILGNTWNDFQQHILDIQDGAKRRVVLLLIQIFTYFIWRERNARKHNTGVLRPEKLLEGIIVDTRSRLVTSTWFSKIVCNRPDLFVI